MIYHYSLITYLVFFYSVILAQPSIEWQKTFGDADYDYGWNIQQTSDDGYIVVGSTLYTDCGISENNGIQDVSVMKLDNEGTIIWQKCLGGSREEGGYSIYETASGGYIMAGYTTSFDGDVMGNNGYCDYWLVELDEGGSIVWQKCFGGSHCDESRKILPLSDGGYIVAGLSYSNDGNVTGNHGMSDYWVVKLDGTGNVVWQKSLGGSDEDCAWDIYQTTDNGFVVAGNSSSNDGDVAGNNGDSDFWVVKLDSSGNMEWGKSLGGSGSDGAGAIVQTDDLGYIVAGSSNSDDGNVTGNHGLSDGWVVKLDGGGSIQWERSLGGSKIDIFTSLGKTLDGNYILGGYTESNDGDVSFNHGEGDFWVVKLNVDGNIIWEKSLGGSSLDGLTRIQQTADTGFVAIGVTYSTDGDITENNGEYDFWVVKLSNDILTSINEVEMPQLTFSPNPFRNQFTISLPSEFRSVESKINIYNLIGQHFNTSFEMSTNAIVVNTANLPIGNYIVELINDESVVGIGKVLKK